MKKLPSWTLTATSVPLALIAGIMLGRSSSGESDATASSSDAPNRNIPTRSGLSGDDSGSASKRDGSSRSSSSDDSTRQQLTAILESSSRLERTQRLLAFLDRLSTDQFASVYEELSDSPMANIRGSERSLILQAWAERDPMSAIAHLEENGADDWERETTLSTWAAIDPAGAFAWAASSEDDGGTNNWMVGTMRGIAATSPELARDFLTQMPDDRTRSRSLETMQGYVMQYGSEYAENWIAGISDSDLKNRASRYLANDLARLDPERAAQWSATITDPNTLREVSEDISESWARQDVESAKSWVMTLPDGARGEAVEGVASQYARQDPTAAAEWLNSLGNSPAYDDAREEVVRASYRQDPATSLNYISNIASERERNRNYERYLGDWMRRDADSARDWALNNQTVLPQNVVDRYLR
ncbi:hypothetical protein ACFQY0_05810 [Haloferula chungangensis]|uniref:HEAT repeat domain-containing protein n=1 Tax=Haloferula chungangensis TaxID=1048331 RepID=A0ABW2L4R2_9BACT